VVVNGNANAQKIIQPHNISAQKKGVEGEGNGTIAADTCTPNFNDIWYMVVMFNLSC
jgi:hypothetical protein